MVEPKSAEEIMREAGIPNLLKGRTLTIYMNENPVWQVDNPNEPKEYYVPKTKK